MKTTLLLALFAFIAISITTVSAQSTRSIELRIGSAIPIGPSDFSNEHSLGYSIGGAIHLGARADFKTGFSLDYSRFPLSVTSLQTFSGLAKILSGGEFTDIAAMLSTQLPLFTTDKFALHATAGAGVDIASESDISYLDQNNSPGTREGHTDAKIGAFGGIGGSFTTRSNLDIGLDARFYIGTGLGVVQIVPIRAFIRFYL